VTIEFSPRYHSVQAGMGSVLTIDNDEAGNGLLCSLLS